MFFDFGWVFNYNVANLLFKRRKNDPFINDVACDKPVLRSVKHFKSIFFYLTSYMEWRPKYSRQFRGILFTQCRCVYQWLNNIFDLREALSMYQPQNTGVSFEYAFNYVEPFSLDSATLSTFEGLNCHFISLDRIQLHSVSLPWLDRLILVEFCSHCILKRFIKLRDRKFPGIE